MAVLTKRWREILLVHALLLLVVPLAALCSFQAAPPNAQKSQQRSPTPSATSDDGKFVVAVRACNRMYDETTIKKNRIECSVSLESKIEGVLRVQLLDVLLTDDQGNQLRPLYNSFTEHNGTDDQTYINPVDPHLPISRHFVFIGAAEDSTSASLAITFQYNPAPVGFGSGALGREHLVIRNFPLRVR